MTPVERLHQALVDALIQSRPHALDQPVTVAEIYQDLVPYRNVRSDLGFAMNADYEHALLQLLAGVEDLARIEPIEIREQLRLELESSNPDVGLFRDFAPCDVFITIPDRRYEPAQPGIETVSPPPPPSQNPLDSLEKRTELPFELPSSEPPPLDREHVAPRQTSGTQPRPVAAVERVEVPKPVRPQVASGNAAASARRCVGCDQSLPREREVRFCPHCGRDQTQRSCSACGEKMEKGWRFCVQCGAPAQTIAQ